MFNRQRGSITVFICILMAVLIPLTCILIDLARYQEAKRLAESSLRVCSESILAAYDRQLREQYGLFAMYPREKESIEKEIYELLSANLNTDTLVEGSTDLYGFQVNQVEVTPIYNLSEPYVLEQHIAEFMKYRAPVQAVTEFLEKLKLMVGLMGESDMISQSMGIDKLLNDLRVDLVHLWYLFDKKMNQINQNQSGGDLKAEVINYIKACNQACLDAGNKATAEITNINNALKAYRNCVDIHKGFQGAQIVAQNTFDETKNRLDQAEQRLKSAEAELDKLEKNKNSSEQDIAAQQASVNSCQVAFNDASSKKSGAEQTLQTANENLKKSQEALGAAKKAFDDAIDKNLNNYGTISQQTKNAKAKLVLFSRHIILHNYIIEKAIQIVEGIKPKLEKLQTERAALEASMEEHKDSAAASQIASNVNAKLMSIDLEVFNNILEQLKRDQSSLQTWYKAIDTSIKAYDELYSTIETERNKCSQLKSHPEDMTNPPVTPYEGHNNVAQLAADLETSLDKLSIYTSMDKGTYSIPSYVPEPVPNDKEYKDSEQWYNRTFSGSDDSVQNPDQKEDSDLVRARENMGNTAATVASGTAPSNENKLSQEELDNLPSREGIHSSKDALEQITKEVMETQLEQWANPLDKPVTGLDTVNEKEKNFFDNQLENMRALLNQVKDLIANGFESIMKSLYMNEFIVSAFKNVATQNNTIENDIGYNRPLESTFFEKAEVEYIIFGDMNENTNINRAKLSIFTIRLVFNLLHVYTDPVKVSETLELATALVGWTVFGIPIMQNFLLVSWAALESYLDTEKLLAGEMVPLLKTTQSWFLQPENLRKYLVETVLGNLKNEAQHQINNTVDNMNQAVQDTVGSFIDAKVDEIFSDVLLGWDGATQEATDQLVSSNFNFQNLDKLEFNSMDDFYNVFTQWVNDQIKSQITKIKGLGQQAIHGVREYLKSKIKNILFGSDGYNKLVQKIKNVGNQLFDKGAKAIEKEIEGAIPGTTVKSGASNVFGKLIMMTYADYLRLMLLTVSPADKAKRTADLMQLNLQKTAGKNDLFIRNYNTYFYVKAYVDFKSWFIPDSLFKQQKAGMISVEWSQGY